jgi:ABC-2 type transport system ATP-binding protein
MKSSKSLTKSTIEVKNIVKTYDNIEAVKNVSFSTHIGEIIALLGPNGAGKSTLMNMIAGFLSPTSGGVFVNGNNVAEKDLLSKKDIGFLPEGAPMYADMTVNQFLKYFIELKLNLDDENSNKKQIYADELVRIKKVAKIENVSSQRIETLSKGYLRRVGFAASLIGNPPILLLDEPTDGLDPNQKEHMRQLISEMSKDKTILISTHLLDEAETLANRIILINKGRVVADGELGDILSKAKKKTLAEAFKFLTNKGA